MADVFVILVVVSLATGFVVDYFHHTAFWPFPAIRQYLENCPNEFVAELASCAFCQTPHVALWLGLAWILSPVVLPVILSGIVQFLIMVMAAARFSWMMDKLLPPHWRYERND